MKIQDLEPQERPREKALKRGIRSLSNRELLAVLLQSGTRKHDVLELADEVMALCGSLDRLMQMQPKDLMQIHGIKQVRAVQLFAGIELSRRIVEIKLRPFARGSCLMAEAAVRVCAAGAFCGCLFKSAECSHSSSDSVFGNIECGNDTSP